MILWMCNPWFWSATYKYKEDANGHLRQEKQRRLLRREEVGEYAFRCEGERE